MGQLSDADMRAIINMRNDSLLEQITVLNQQNVNLFQNDIQAKRVNFFVVLQMKVIALYMYLFNHENRYFLDRMTHIAWVLTVLVLLQFHLLHISSFSFINCMSEQIV